MTIMLAVLNGILLGSVICVLIHNIKMTEAVESRRGALNDELATMINKVSEVNNNIVGAFKRLEAVEQENSSKIAMLMTHKGVAPNGIANQTPIINMFQKRSTPIHPPVEPK